MFVIFQPEAQILHRTEFVPKWVKICDNNVADVVFLEGFQVSCTSGGVTRKENIVLEKGREERRGREGEEGGIGEEEQGAPFVQINLPGPIQRPGTIC